MSCSDRNNDHNGLFIGQYCIEKNTHDVYIVDKIIGTNLIHLKSLYVDFIRIYSIDTVMDLYFLKKRSWMSHTIVKPKKQIQLNIGELCSFDVKDGPCDVVISIMPPTTGIEAQKEIREMRQKLNQKFCKGTFMTFDIDHTNPTIEDVQRLMRLGKMIHTLDTYKSVLCSANNRRNLYESSATTTAAMIILMECGMTFLEAFNKISKWNGPQVIPNQIMLNMYADCKVIEDYSTLFDWECEQTVRNLPQFISESPSPTAEQTVVVFGPNQPITQHTKMTSFTIPVGFKFFSFLCSKLPTCTISSIAGQNNYSVVLDGIQVRAYYLKVYSRKLY